ncbi:hypothetical protein MIR68_003670 [Amoeboaphelidium protococcarum]|nr:hypothetical protein MIR68_003670 [Amoeboaphelidium protococcarum]
MKASILFLLSLFCLLSAAYGPVIVYLKSPMDLDLGVRYYQTLDASLISDAVQDQFCAQQNDESISYKLSVLLLDDGFDAVNLINGHFDKQSVVQRLVSDYDQSMSSVAIGQIDTFVSPQSFVSDLVQQLQQNCPLISSSQIINIEESSSIQEILDDNNSHHLIIMAPKTLSQNSQRNLYLQKRQINEPSTNSTEKFFSKNQLFSPAILMGITSAVWAIAITVLGISWLLSIQTPTRFDIPTKQKKQ